MSSSFSLNPSRFLLYAALTLLGACSSEEATEKDLARPVEIIRVGQHNGQLVREFSGQIERANLTPLSAEVMGKVKRVLVKNGQFVRQGTLLAQIDPEAYSLALQRAQAQHTQLSQDLLRKKTLNDEGILPDTSYEQLVAATEAARVAKQLAERDLRLSQIRAPFSGRIANRLVEIEQFVSPGTPLFQFENTQRPQVSIDIPQDSLNDIVLSSSLNAEAWLPEQAEQRFMLSYAEHKSVAVGGNTVFRVTFNTAPNSQLYAGMALRVKLLNTSPKFSNTLNLPASTVRRDNTQQPFIWRVDPKTSEVSKVKVTLKQVHKHDVLVEAPLTNDDLIVAAGSAFLRDKQRVRAIRELP